MTTGLLDRPSAARPAEPPPRLVIELPQHTNAATEAINFYHSLGRRLDPWQRLCLRIGLGELGDGRWSAFEVGIIVQRQNGKGLITECLELAALFLWGTRVIIHSAHQVDTALKAYRSMKELINVNEDLARRCKPMTDSGSVIELVTGGRVEFKTRSGRGGRGLTGDLVVLDEALELNEEQLAALVPILLAMPYAQLWYTSTVPSHADQHLMSVRKRALSGESPRLAWIEWGVDPGADPRDPVALWTANPALASGRLTLERLDDLLSILGTEKFLTECMGIWPAGVEGTILDPVKWKTMLDELSARFGDVCISVDISPSRSWATISLFGLREDGLEHVQVLDRREGVDWVAARLAEWKEALNPIAIVLDRANGVYAMLGEFKELGMTPPVDEHTDEEREPQRGDLLVLETRAVCDGVAQFVDAFNLKLLRHKGQKVLTDAVENAKPRPVGDAGAIAWGRRKSSIDIGPLITVTQARYGFYLWKDVVVQEYDLLGSITAVDGQCPYCDAWSPGGPVEHYEDCVTLRVEALTGG